MINTRPYFLKIRDKAATKPAVGFGVIIFLLLHIPLALLMRQSEMLATLHALLTLGMGSLWALQGKNKLVVWTLGYIAGAEVLWRMTEANVFWEFGKYAAVFIILIFILRGRRLSPPLGMIFYLVLLLPAIALTLTAQTLAQAREGISFNLSGPLAIFMCTWFFAGVEIDITTFKKLVWALIAPLTGIVTIAWSIIIASGKIVFSASSNFETSGGYGPNQVSGILGLGIFLIFVVILLGQDKFSLRAALFGVLFAFITEVFLTFARTGAYLTGASIMASALFWVKTAKERIRIVFIFGIILLISIYAVFPYLESFTAGYFSERFTDTGLTGRDSIVEADLKIWQEHLIFGVGPGLAGDYRAEFYNSAAAHTEYSRMLAEHGLFGLAALILLLATTFRQVYREISTREGALKLGCWIFALLFMAVSAIRLVAPAFMLGLIFANITLIQGQVVPNRKSLRQHFA